jgi:CheY-like chemotaxis protein
MVSKPVALVVDDEPDIREVIAFMLDRAGSRSTRSAAAKLAWQLPS